MKTKVNTWYMTNDNWSVKCWYIQFGVLFMNNLIQSPLTNYFYSFHPWRNCQCKHSAPNLCWRGSANCWRHFHWFSWFYCHRSLWIPDIDWMWINLVEFPRSNFLSNKLFSVSWTFSWLTGRQRGDSNFSRQDDKRYWNVHRILMANNDKFDFQVSKLQHFRSSCLTHEFQQRK